MPYGMYLSAAGAQAQNHRLEVISHNLANINTPGFKPLMSVLQARNAEAIDQGETLAGSGGIDDLGGGVKAVPTRTQFQQGPIEQTKRPTDFAINNSKGFFVVQRGEEQLLTRAGDFVFNSNGTLTTTNGDPVMSVAGAPIQVDPTKPYQVRDDGEIQQAGQIHRLQVVTPNSMGDLSRIGDNLYRPLAATTPVPATQREVVSGHLERSAVQPTTAMMELIEASRVYEANLRLIQHQDQSIGSLVGRLLKDS
ncbi:MAG: flagellar hook basal-body protein [Pirellulales bacterium]